MEQRHDDGLVDEVLEEETNGHACQPKITQKVPVPIVDVLVVGQDLHEVDCHRPANAEQEEHHAVKPVVIPIDLLLANKDLLFVRSQLLLAQVLLMTLSDLLHTVVFVPQLLVDLLVEQLTPQERQNYRTDPGDKGRPNEHSNTSGLLFRDDGSNDEGLDCYLGQDDRHSGQFGEEVSVADLKDGVEGPTSPGIISEVFAIETGLGDGV